MTMPDVVPEIMRGAGPFDVAGDYYLVTTGGDGSRASTPDHASLDITGDWFIGVEMGPGIPLPGTGINYEFIGKRVIPSQQTVLFALTPAGLLWLRWSTDGSNSFDRFSTVPLPRPRSAASAFGVWLDVSNAGNHVVTFYAADTLAAILADPAGSTLGAAVTTAGTTSVFSSTSPLEIAEVLGSGFAPIPAKFLRAQVRSGSSAGTIVANPDFTTQAPGTTSFVDSAGRTWTVHSPAAIVGFDWEPIPDDANERPRLKSLNWEVGRSNELDNFPPGTGTAVFRSNDRLLDPEYTAGDLFGDLGPRVPLRFRTVAPAADLFYGFPEDGWTQQYDKPNASRCTVQMRDLLGVIQDMPLPGSAYEAEVLADGPGALWKLDETTGTQMADSSGNGRHGIYDNAVLGQDPLILGNGHSVEFPHVGDNRGRWSGEGLPVGAPCTLEAWVQTSRDLFSVKSILVVQRDSSLGQRLWLGVPNPGGGSPNGELVVDFAGLGTGYRARGHTRIDDDEPHHVVCTIAGNTAADVVLYVDGEVQTKTTISGTDPGSWPSLLLWTVGNYTDNGFGDFGFEGRVDEVAVYDYVLTPDRVLAHYEAGSAAFDGDTSGERVGRVLDIVGVPEALRDIATGDTTVGPADYRGQTAGEYLNRVVESEQGVLFVDHPGGGKLKFRGRYARFTETRSTVSQATFTDELDPPGKWCYRNDIAPEPNGVQSIVNAVDVQWRGGTEIVTDDESISAYGPRSRTLTTEAPTPESARSAGAWLTSRYAQPQTRIRQLPLAPGGGQAGLDAVVLGQEISDRITVERTPVGVGAQVVNELIVEGIRNEMEPDQSWYATYNTSNVGAADDADLWIWDQSTWNENTRWG